jgi:putative transcriptional regulator
MKFNLSRQLPKRLDHHLLLATPTIRDSVFEKSVVLITEHSAVDGALGLALNVPTGQTVGDFLQTAELSALKKVPVHVGGPVAQDQLSFSALWWGENDQLEWKIRVPSDEAVRLSRRRGVLLKAFIGYSGWSPGQLEDEMGRDSWLNLKPQRSLLGMDHDHSLWHELLRPISVYHRIIADAPDDPGTN